MNAFDRYIHEAKMNRKAIIGISQDPNLSTSDKSLLTSAAKFGKWTSIGIQFPLITLGTIFVNKKVVHYPKEKKFLAYSFGFLFYFYFYTASNAFAWTQAYNRVEPIIKSYILKKMESESLHPPILTPTN